MAAEELKATLDFSTNAWELPVGSSAGATAAADFSNGTYTINLMATTKYYFNSDGYLMLGKSGSTLTLPAFEWNTTKIVVTGRAGASTSTVQNIYVGEEAVSTATTGCTGANEFVIAENYQEAGNVYVLKIGSAHNAQIVTIDIYGEGEGGEGGGGEAVMAYYLVGTNNGWDGTGYQFAENPGAEGEYMLDVTFAANDEYKVVGVLAGDTTWYPDGVDNNHVVAEAGDYTVYFRPAGNPEWEAYYFYDAVKEAPVTPLYDVAEAIAAAPAENAEIMVRGIITKIEFKGKNFAKYGSANIYVADATGAEGEFEFYNCYSFNADTFRVSSPEYDAESTAWAEFEMVADENGNEIHLGDTVIAFGKFTIYVPKGTTDTIYELKQGCNIVDVKHYVEPIELVKAFFLLPTLNQPGDENIEMAGSFVEGTMNMLKLETGYFVNDVFVNAKADDIFKLRDKTNTDIVLCKYNARKEIWEQAIFTFGDYWSKDSYKGTPCMWIEKEFNDSTMYAWLEGMPEPQPQEEVVLNLTNGQMLVATDDEGTYAQLELFNFENFDEEGYAIGDGEWLTMYLLPETHIISGVYTAENMFGDLYSVAGEDTLYVDIVEANIAIELSDIDEEESVANLKASGWFIAENDVRYNFEANFDIYYEEYEEPSEGVANVATEAKTIKRIEMGNVVIEKNGVKYSVNGQILK